MFSVLFEFNQFQKLHISFHESVEAKQAQFRSLNVLEITELVFENQKFTILPNTQPIRKNLEMYSTNNCWKHHRKMFVCIKHKPKFSLKTFEYTRCQFIRRWFCIENLIDICINPIFLFREFTRICKISTKHKH